jgi:hypothetical protein
MYPILFRIGDFPITSFGLMMFLSFTGGAWAAGKMLARYGLDPRLIWDLLAGTAVAGIVGASEDLLPCVALASPRGLLIARDGLVWYGGLIGGALAYYLQVRSRKLPPAVMFDATAPALMLASHSGASAASWWAMTTASTDGPLGVAFPQGMPPSTAGYLRSVGDHSGDHTGQCGRGRASRRSCDDASRNAAARDLSLFEDTARDAEYAVRSRDADPRSDRSGSRGGRVLRVSVALVAAPFSSGESSMEMGITKAGNRHIRAMAIEMAGARCDAPGSFCRHGRCTAESRAGGDRVLS